MQNRRIILVSDNSPTTAKVFRRLESLGLDVKLLVSPFPVCNNFATQMIYGKKLLTRKNDLLCLDSLWLNICAISNIRAKSNISYEQVELSKMLSFLDTTITRETITHNLDLFEKSFEFRLLDIDGDLLYKIKTLPNEDAPMWAILTALFSESDVDPNSASLDRLKAFWSIFGIIKQNFTEEICSWIGNILPAMLANADAMHEWPKFYANDSWIKLITRINNLSFSTDKMEVSHKQWNNDVLFSDLSHWFFNDAQSINFVLLPAALRQDNHSYICASEWLSYTDNKVTSSIVHNKNLLKIEHDSSVTPSRKTADNIVSNAASTALIKQSYFEKEVYVITDCILNSLLKLRSGDILNKSKVTILLDSIPPHIGRAVFIKSALKLNDEYLCNVRLQTSLDSQTFLPKIGSYFNDALQSNNPNIEVTTADSQLSFYRGRLNKVESLPDDASSVLSTADLCTLYSTICDKLSVLIDLEESIDDYFVKISDECYVFENFSNNCRFDMDMDYLRNEIVEISDSKFDIFMFNFNLYLVAKGSKFDLGQTSELTIYVDNPSTFIPRDVLLQNANLYGLTQIQLDNIIETAENIRSL